MKKLTLPRTHVIPSSTHRNTSLIYRRSSWSVPCKLQRAQRRHHKCTTSPTEPRESRPSITFNRCQLHNASGDFSLTFGALLSGGSEEFIHSIGCFAEAIGVAFQIQDGKFSKLKQVDKIS